MRECLILEMTDIPFRHPADSTFWLYLLITAKRFIILQKSVHLARLYKKPRLLWMDLLMLRRCFVYLEGSFCNEKFNKSLLVFNRFWVEDEGKQNLSQNIFCANNDVCRRRIHRPFNIDLIFFSSTKQISCERAKKYETTFYCFHISSDFSTELT